MDLIIKNLERLKDYSDGNHRPIERVVVDFDKLATEDFAQVFFDACEKYVEVGESYLVPNKDIRWRMSLERKCINCKHCELDSTQEPCRSCWKSIENRPNWEPAEPSLKEVTERMQSEFDATGKDVKIFMNERVIKR